MTTVCRGWLLIAAFRALPATPTCPKRGLRIHQTLIDPDDWSLHLTLDLEKSNEARTPVLQLESIATI